MNDSKKIKKRSNLNCLLPRISIVTPSFNQAQFLEQTIQSVLNQNYPNLEYIIIDGASTDGSVDIIKKYADKLTYWESVPDKGQYDAIKKGFDMSSGEIMAWINSDDMYLPWTFNLVGRIFKKYNDIEWIISLLPASWNEDGVICGIQPKNGYCQNFFLRGLYLRDGIHANKRFIQQESSFWKRELWEKSGSGFSTKYLLAADFELWARFFNHAIPWGVKAILGGFRRHQSQQSVLKRKKYIKEAMDALRFHGGKTESTFASFLRQINIAPKWLLYKIPSLGIVEKAFNLHWSSISRTWEKRIDWIKS